MRKEMKKYVMALMALIMSVSMAHAFVDSYTVKRESLSQAAQEMLKEHFPKAKVSMIKVDRHLLKKTDYDVKLTNGTKIDFSNKGEWKSVDCGKKAVPEALVPKAIRNNVTKKFGDVKITAIAKRNAGYDVTLSDGSKHRYNLLNQYKGALE